jgi:hypothetical protein
MGTDAVFATGLGPIDVGKWFQFAAKMALIDLFPHCLKVSIHSPSSDHL